MLGSVLDAVSFGLGVGARFIFLSHNAYHKLPDALSVPSPPAAK
jgi:hypothetical protein